MTRDEEISVIAPILQNHSNTAAKVGFEPRPSGCRGPLQVGLALGRLSGALGPCPACWVTWERL